MQPTRFGRNPRLADGRSTPGSQGPPQSPPVERGSERIFGSRRSSVPEVPRMRESACCPCTGFTAWRMPASVELTIAREPVRPRRRNHSGVFEPLSLRCPFRRLSRCGRLPRERRPGGVTDVVEAERNDHADRIELISRINGLAAAVAPVPVSGLDRRPYVGRRRQAAATRFLDGPVEPISAHTPGEYRLLADRAPYARRDSFIYPTIDPSAPAVA